MTTRASSSRLQRLLARIEQAGNALPHPTTLFASMALAVVVVSAVSSALGLQAAHPATGEPVVVVNLLTRAGVHRILNGLVANFVGFAPLGTVLVALIGIGVAEHSGLMRAALRHLVLSSPRALLTPIVVFAGVLSNMASEIGYVLLVPLAGILFQAAGRHPVAGLAAGFAGVSGGYSANLLLGTIDPLLAGLTQEAARIVAPTYEVNAAANYYLMIVSTFMVTAVVTLVTERIVVPRLGAPPVVDGTAANDEPDVGAAPLSPAERRGLVAAGVALVVMVVGIAFAIVPEGGFLRDIATGGVLKSPLLSGVVSFIFLGGVILGVAYGVAAGTFKSDRDAIVGMDRAMTTLGSYIVLVFFAAQFVAFFNWTNLGLIVAVKGAAALQSLGLSEIPLFVAFILLAAVLNLLMGSASAKWALMAPVFVPMFMLLGYSPELTQAAYRIGDSATNIISPMMAYFVLIIAFVQRYDPKAGMGTVISLMLPYSVAIGLSWTVLFSVFLWFDLPLGPGAGTTYP